MYADIIPMSDLMKLPEKDKIRQEQARYVCLQKARENADGVVKCKERLWIPNDATKLRQRLVLLCFLVCKVIEQTGKKYLCPIKALGVSRCWRIKALVIVMFHVCEPLLEKQRNICCHVFIV